jgi:tetratricopeptide (TPR) repeat protein
MKIAPEGRYQIKIKELRPGKELDKPIVAASRLMSEGLQLEVKATADSVRKAIAKYQEAIPLWHLAGETEWEADANYLIANLYTFLGDKQKALEFANVALPLARKAVENQQDPEAKKKSITVEATRWIFWESCTTSSAIRRRLSNSLTNRCLFGEA